MLDIKYHKTAFELEPKYGTEHAACFDLKADLGGLGREVCFSSRYQCHTGIYMEIPEGYVGLVFPRSGLACKENITLANCVGVIDSDYRGEIMVTLVDHSEEHKSHIIKHADRIAQMMIIPVQKCNLISVSKNELTETKRGQNGLGSTGKQ